MVKIKLVFEIRQNLITITLTIRYVWINKSIYQVELFSLGINLLILNKRTIFLPMYKY